MGFRDVVIATVVLSIVVAGTWPGERSPVNEITWDDTGGLRLVGESQAVSRSPIWAEDGELTLELWLDGPGPRVWGNFEIASLVDAPDVHELMLGRFQGGWILRSRRDNPTGDPKRDTYVVDGNANAAHHLALVVDASGGALHVEGVARAPTLRVAQTTSGAPLGGRLVVGSSRPGTDASPGVLHAIALHGRALEAHEITRRAKLGWTHEGAFDAERIAADPASRDLLSLQLFDEGQGRIARDRIEAGADLILPERLSRPLAGGALRWPPSGAIDRNDVTLNLLGFVPLGIALAWRRGPNGLGLAIGLGLTLSLGIELAQCWIPGRDSSALDLVCNVAGSAAGGTLTILATRRS